MPRRYAVMGNCQADGFAQVLCALRPDAVVDRPAPEPGPGGVEAMVARLADYDAVFAQPVRKRGAGLLRSDILAERVPRLVLYPMLSFRGFHPDEIGLVRAGAWLGGPIGTLHSLIATAAFLEGLSAERAARLYNRFVFASLGYFDEYERSMAFLEKTSAEIGFDLPVAALRRLGNFMHTTVHPRIEAIATLVPVALRRAGETVPDGAERDLKLVNYLGRMACFATYPEIARHLGLPAGTGFLRHKRYAVASGGRAMSLPEFIRDSYAILQAAPDTELDVPVVTSARAVLRAAGLR
jgi:hypothetical protein